MDFAALERREGVRLSWNAWPSSRIEATRVAGGLCMVDNNNSTVERKYPHHIPSGQMLMATYVTQFVVEYSSPSYPMRESECVPSTQVEFDVVRPSREVLPFGAVCTPCRTMDDMPVLPYAPVVCAECSAVISPYCTVDFHQKRWQCCLCNHGNTLPRNYHGKDCKCRLSQTQACRLAAPPPRCPAAHPLAFRGFARRR